MRLAYTFHRLLHFTQAACYLPTLNPKWASAALSSQAFSDPILGPEIAFLFLAFIDSGITPTNLSRVISQAEKVRSIWVV